MAPIEVPRRRRSIGRFRFGLVATLSACVGLLLAVSAPSALAAPAAAPGYGFVHGFGAGTTEVGFVLSNENPIALDGNGLLYWSGGGFAGQGKVFVFAPDPTAGGVRVGEVSAAGQNPVDVALDPVNNALYVQDALSAQNVLRYLSNNSFPPTYTKDPSYPGVPSSQGGADGIAIDPTTRDLLVIDPSTESIKRYDTAGNALASTPLPFPPAAFAVLPDGTLYLTRPGTDKIVHFDSAGTNLGEVDVGGEAQSIAIDPSSGAIVVLVAGNIKLYSSGGVFESETSGHGATRGLALDAAGGRLYAWTGGPFEPGEVVAFQLGIIAGVETPTATITGPESVRIETEVDPGAGPPPGSAIQAEYSTDGGATWTATPARSVAGPETVTIDVTALEPDRDYQFRVRAFNSVTTVASTAVPVHLPAVAPLVKAGKATDISETRAVLNGNINPAGLPTSYYFEYGTTTAYGSRVPVGVDGAAGNGRVPRTYSRTVSGLAPGTTYHFRLVATNELGTTNGPDGTFTTAAPGAIPARVYEQVTPPEKHGMSVIPALGFITSPSGEGFSYVTKSGSNSSPMVTRSIALRGSEDWSGKIDTDPPLNVGSGPFLVNPTLAVSDDFTKALVVSNRALTPGGVENGANVLLFDIKTGTYRLIAATGAPNAFNSLVGSKTAGTYLGGAPDFSWIVFNSPKPLINGAPNDATYRWSESAGLEVASVLPDGEMSSAMHATSASTYQSISDDGSRLYFTAYNGSEEGVFLREGNTTRVVALSDESGGLTGAPKAVLLGTDANGRYAFLTSSLGLTPDAPGEQDDLYRYDATDGSLEYLGAQAYTYTSAPGVVYGSFDISPDGNTLYFNNEPRPSSNGEFSVWRDGEIHHILPGSLLVGEEHPSPNGRYFVVKQTVEGVPNVVEVYDSVTNELTCASCKPDGTPVGASLPEGGELYGSNRFPQTVGDNGEVYFDTTARLVAADVNGTRDVYVSEGGSPRLISPGNRPFEANFSDMSEDGRDVFFTTAQKLVGRDNDESIDVYDARVGGGLAAQNPPPPLVCLRDDCKAVPNSGPELPFGGSEALSGPGNLTPTKKLACGKGKHKVKVKAKGKGKARTKCVKQRKAGKNKKGAHR